MTKHNGPGRPAGSKTQDAEVVEIIASCCRKCGSDAVAWSGPTRTFHRTGRTAGGVVFDREVHVRRKCDDCGQIRVEKRRYPKPQK